MSPADRRGASIVEIMMSTTILLVGFIGFIEALTIMSEALDTARRQQAAQQVLAGEIEKLRGRDWTSIANLPASATITIDRAGAISGDTTSFALSNFSATASDDNTSLSTLAKGFTCTLSRTRLRPAAATAH